MTGTEPASPDYSRRAVGFALACLLLGPPIGALLIMLGIPLAELVQTRGASLGRFEIAAVGQYLAASLFASLLSFLFGGLPALASAIWIGARTCRSGSFGYGGAFVVALVATLLLAPVKPPATADPSLWTLGNLVLPASLASALILRWILGPWMR